MESEILVEGFKKSLEMHNLIYGRLISDGDANTYSKILQARPYDKFTVEKVECRNHLLRNFCNKLVAITSETKYPKKFRSYLTKKRILSMRKVVVEAIKINKDTGHVSSLHQDIMNAAEHAFGRHNKCKNYYCTKNEDDKNIDENLFSNSIWLRIKLMISQLAAHSRSLAVDVDSNSVERYHSIVAKFVGGKRINFSQKYQYMLRCNAAAISFNTRKPLSILHKSIVGQSAQNNIKKYEEWKAKKLESTKKYIKKKIRFEKQDPRNYGEDCSKPDIDEEMMLRSKEAFLRNLRKSSEERERIAKETVLQSGCSEWLELRRNILTSSNFGRVIKRRLYTSCQNIVKDILYKKSIEHVQSIRHGKDNEKLALEQLSAQENIKILTCGLHIDPDVPYFAASPDGITENGILVEIKCPKSSFNIGLETAVDNKKIPFYKKDRDGSLTINKEHYWYYQVQGQLHVTRREKCLFAIWSGENFPVKTEMIDRDDRFWAAKMEKKLEDFYLDCLLPELIDPRFLRKMPIRDPNYITDAIKMKNEKQAIKRKAEPIVLQAKKNKL